MYDINDLLKECNSIEQLIMALNEAEQKPAKDAAKQGEQVSAGMNPLEQSNDQEAIEDGGNKDAFEDDGTMPAPGGEEGMAGAAPPEGSVVAIGKKVIDDEAAAADKPLPIQLSKDTEKVNTKPKSKEEEDDS